MFLLEFTAAVFFDLNVWVAMTGLSLSRSKKKKKMSLNGRSFEPNLDRPADLCDLVTNGRKMLLNLPAYSWPGAGGTCPHVY